MHQHAITLYKKSQSGGDVTAHAPVAKALTALDGRTVETVKKKFELAYFLCKENLPFIKMVPVSARREAWCWAYNRLQE